MNGKYPIRICRWHHPDLVTHLLGILQGVAEVLDGCVTLLSLGFYMSNFEMKVSFHRAYYDIKRRKR